jgi:hypothetical protein
MFLIFIPFGFIEEKLHASDCIKCGGEPKIRSFETECKASDKTLVECWHPKNEELHKKIAYIFAYLVGVISLIIYKINLKYV